MITYSTGCYGKVPGLGDFIVRGLPGQFVQPWDRWLRESLAASQERLGEGWLDTYLTSPLWHFALTPGILGQGGWAGVLMPSVDRVGRYFPLTIASPLPAAANPLALLENPAWFEQAEAIALGALADDFDLAAMEAGLLALQAPSLLPLRSWAGDPTSVESDAWHLALGTGTPPSAALSPLLARALEDLFLAYSLWWTTGSEQVEPSLLACQGLPPPEGFAAMLAGGWGGRGWAILGRAP